MTATRQTIAVTATVEGTLFGALYRALPGLTHFPGRVEITRSGAKIGDARWSAVRGIVDVSSIAAWCGETVFQALEEALRAAGAPSLSNSNPAPVRPEVRR